MSVWILTQWAATLVMTGVIWFVQLVHYPAYRNVGDATFVAYQREHTRRTTWVVFPPMLVELMTAGLWAIEAWKAPELRVWAWPGVGLVALLWGSTMFWQVPLHDRLSRKRDPEVIEKLIRSNWLRTWAWTTRSLMIGGWIAKSI
jgi:hypothetical protein